MDKSDRIQRINEAISFLFERRERDTRSFSQRQADRARERLSLMNAREELRSRASEIRAGRQKEADDKTIARWNTDEEIKRLGLDTKNLPEDPLQRAKAIKRESWKQTQERLAARPDFETTQLGQDAKKERERIVGREMKLGRDATPEEVNTYNQQQRDAMNQARARDRDPAAKAAYQEAEKAKKIADWQASQKAAMLGRIGARTPAGAEFVAAEAGARAAEQNLAQVTANQKSEAQIRADARSERDATEAEVRATNPEGYGSGKFDPVEYAKAINYNAGKVDVEGNPRNKPSGSPPPSQNQPAKTGKHRMYNRQTGKIEMSDSPGVDRVFTDSKGDYRVEGGSGRKIYV